jgi:hypothetical protein
MKTYSITIRYVGYATIWVEAESEDQACELVWDEWDGTTEGASNDIIDIDLVMEATPS